MVQTQNLFPWLHLCYHLTVQLNKPQSKIKYNHYYDNKTNFKLLYDFTAKCFFKNVIDFIFQWGFWGKKANYSYGQAYLNSPGSDILHHSVLNHIQR